MKCTNDQIACKSLVGVDFTKINSLLRCVIFNDYHFEYNFFNDFRNLQV